ncbi:hypothetical protein QFZ75_001171 [Streptomyces sp. V3I8]|uniref:hypothetical protein n=1 Tax=Streptomyces sp. V3I8 TaxID=3042279 RepID=UPI00278275F8|nr:hypothetical protein [Streptomyces sp. V3I8]MDQ1034755.1 hypothetical protein [Streptomyces sp. V3I8]
MSIEHKRWAQYAQKLRLEQLPTARKQAEVWRTGLTGMTTLLGIVLVVKGHETIGDLASWTRVTVAVLLVMTFGGLLTATVLAVRAAAGTPGAEILLTGEGLREWTRHEVKIVARRIWCAALLTFVALSLLVAALGFTWFGPVSHPEKPTVRVVTRGDSMCGELVGTADGNVVVKGESLKETPISRIVSIEPVKSCSRP